MTPEHIHALYGPTVRAVPAWRIVLGDQIVMTRTIDKPGADCSPVVSVGLNNGVVHLTTKNGLTWEHAENAEVLIVEGK